MNKKFLTLAAAALVVGGFSSCNKTVVTGSAGSEGSGNLQLSVAFASPSLSKSDASYTEGISDLLVPTSSDDDITSLIAIVYNSNEVLYGSYDLTAQIKSDSKTAMIADLPVDTYKVYVVANHTTDETSAYTNGYGGLPSGSNVLPTSTILDIAAATGTDGLLSGNSTTIYTAAPNYFVGCAEFTITNASTTTQNVGVKRVVNLVRARVKLGDDNSTISFNDAKAGFMLRRVQSTYDVSKYDATDLTVGYAYDSSPAQTASYSSGNFYTSNPSTGYTGSSHGIDNDYTFFKDMLVFPPSKTAAATDADETPNSLSVIVYGVTTDDDYIPASASSAVDAGTVLYWVNNNVSFGDVSQVYEGNKVIVLNLSLENRGQTGGVGDISKSGNMNITVTVEDWDGYITQDVTM